MELSWLQSLLLGLISGFAEVLPVSAEAHRLLLLKLFGQERDPAVLRLFIHLSTIAALHFCCRGHIVRMMRSQRLAKVPKRRRKRPLDTDALMDFSLLKTTLIPVILGFLLYTRLDFLGTKLHYVAGILALNGLILYVPQFLPGSNKESGAMTRVDGLILGLGGSLGILPGISCVGAAVSIGSVRGMDPKKALNLALLMNIPVNLGLVVFDLLELFGGGISLSFGAILGAVLAAVAAFVGIVLGIRLLQKIAQTLGYSVFSFYSWTLALLMFFIYLTAV